jgi:hypothetical protein
MPIDLPARREATGRSEPKLKAQYVAHPHKQIGTTMKVLKKPIIKSDYINIF